MVRFFSALGAPLIAFVQYLGELVLLAADTFPSIFMLEINDTSYMANMVRWPRSRYITMGLSKEFCSGILIVFISCQKGLPSRQGSVGVRRASTKSVVNASLAVLICNLFLTMMF